MATPDKRAPDDDGGADPPAACDGGVDLSAVPLFPLPNVVLFPRAVLPLHIFEERYKRMTADALAGDRLLAMALLRPGWEKSYYGRPDIEPVVCVGRIVSHERLPDGCYNFLLQGLIRARVGAEHPPRQGGYRTASLSTLPERAVLEIDLAEERTKLTELFHASKGAMGRVGLAPQFRKLIQGPMPTPDILDLAAFNFLEDPLTKHELLSDADVRHRVDRTLAELRVAASHLPATSNVGIAAAHARSDYPGNTADLN